MYTTKSQAIKAKIATIRLSGPLPLPRIVAALVSKELGEPVSDQLVRRVVKEVDGKPVLNGTLGNSIKLYLDKHPDTTTARIMKLFECSCSHAFLAKKEWEQERERQFESAPVKAKSEPQRPVPTKTIYAKISVASDKKGYYRFLGGKRWRLGKDEQLAKLASAKLIDLYQTAKGWTDAVVCDLAHAIAKGQTTYAIPPNQGMDHYATQYGHIITIITTPSNKIAKTSDNDIASIQKDIASVRDLLARYGHKKLAELIELVTAK